MLDKYIDYENFYKILTNSINDHKISHAYMFEIDDSINVDEFKVDIVKILLTENGTLNKDLLDLIELNNYPNVRYIIPDGQFIKRDQIVEMQDDFSKESFDNKTKIYVIVGADKLHKVAANRLLKFLEEPQSDIIAVFITNNRYAVIDTIKSRCINISLKRKVKERIDKESLEYKTIEIIEANKNKSLYLLYDLFNSESITREEVGNIFVKVSEIYLDLLNISNNLESCFYVEKDLKEIEFDNSKKILIKKIDVINKYLDYLRVNLNIKTFIDEIIYGIYGGD